MLINKNQQFKKQRLRHIQYYDLYIKSLTEQNTITKEMQDVIKKRYVYQYKKLNEVVYMLLSETDKRPINERIDFRDLDRCLKFELANNGINIPYHFRLLYEVGC